MKHSEKLTLKKAAVVLVILVAALYYLFSLGSCQKNQSSFNIPQLQNDNLLNHIGTSTESLLFYDDILQNKCYPENVHVTGSVKEDVREFEAPDKVYYIREKMDFSDLLGIGETSGLIYSPKGQSYFDGLSVVALDSGDQRSIGRQTYELTLSTPQGNEIIIDEKARFLRDVKGNVITDFQNYVDTCK